MEDLFFSAFSTLDTQSTALIAMKGSGEITTPCHFQAQVRDSDNE